MQFTSIALLGLSVLATAAPVELDSRTGGTTVCCPKGKKEGCTEGPPTSGGGDTYNNCSFVQQIGLIDLFLCDILNDLTLSIPVTVAVPITL